MADVAVLGFRIESSDAERARQRLDRLSGAARKTETSSRRMTGALDRVRGSLRGISGAGGPAASVLGKVNGRMAALAAVAAAVSAAMVKLAHDALDFGTAMREVSTLVDTATTDMAGLRQAVKDASSTYGTSGTQQAKALYQIISAGASDAASAITLLDASNRLAIGGVTQIAVAADGLTSVLNAYGLSASRATSVSDALFVAMRAGKTTIGELSGALGRVATLAATVGVSFDELAAAVSTLTKAGISTNESITGVRAILAAVAKPSAEAQKLAAALGLEFSAAAVRAKGLSGFLADLREKTRGNTQAMAVLMGGVEALNPALVLTGKGAKDFAAIMDQMSQKSGQTSLALKKMASDPAFQLHRIWSGLKDIGLTFVNAVLQPMAPAFRVVSDVVGGVASALSQVVSAIGDLATFMYVPQLISAAFDVTGISLMASWLSQLGERVRVAIAYVKAFAAEISARLAPAWQTMQAYARATFDGMMAYAALSIDFMARKWGDLRSTTDSVFSTVLASMRWFANRTIGAGVGAVSAITSTWRKMPAAMGDAALASANAVISAMERMVNGSIALLNRMISGVNSVLQAVGMDGISTIGQVSFGRIKNGFVGGMADLGASARDAFLAAYSADYVGKADRFFSAVAERARKALAPPDLPALSQPANAPVGVDGMDIGGLIDKGEKGKRGKPRNLVNKTKAALDESLKAFQRWRDGVASTIADGLAAVVMGTKKISAAFREMAMSIVQSAVKTLLNVAVRKMLGMFGGFFGGGGTPFGLGGTGGLYASGVVFSGGREVHAFARGGIVSRPTVFPMRRGMGLMGEAGPEAIMPLRRGRDGRLGVASSGGGGVVVNIINQAGAQIETRERRGADGRREIEIMVQRMVDERIDRAASVRPGMRIPTTRR